MASTVVLDILDASWTPLGNVSDTLLVQLSSSGAILLRADATAPDPSDEEGVTLSNSGLAQIVFHASSDTGQIFAKAKLHSPVKVTVVTIAGG